jgi:hypothetical protein
MELDDIPHHRSPHFQTAPSFASFDSSHNHRNSTYATFHDNESTEMLEASFGDMNQYESEYVTTPPPHARKGLMSSNSMNDILLGSTNNTYQGEEYRSLQDNDYPRRQKSQRTPRKKKFSFSDCFGNCFNRRKNKEAAGPRLIYVNSDNLNAEQKFLHNKVFTAKYSTFTFLPKFLYVEFSKYANLFFLFISGIQVILPCR